MRVLIVTHYYPEHRGGVETVAGELARRFGARGMKVIWAASAPAGQANEEGVTRVPMGALTFIERTWGIGYPIWDPLSLLQLYREAKQCDVLLIHDALQIGGLVSYLTARFWRRPIVVAQHIGLVPYPSRVFRTLLSLANNILARGVLEGCSASIVISEKIRQYFNQDLGIRKKLECVPNGLDVDTFSPLSDEARQQLRARFGWASDKPIMLFVGRFVQVKGMSLLHQLAASFPQCDWVFVGWGRDAPARWGLSNVRCLGAMAQEDIVPYYQAADLLVLPSVGEGFPLVVQEAMACGTPVLMGEDTATGMPGIQSAAYVASLDLQHLGDALRNILRDRAELAIRRHQVCEFASRHWKDWDCCADQYLKLFSRLLEPAKRSRLSRKLPFDKKETMLAGSEPQAISLAV